jgi:hypothetical protein
MYRIVEVVVKQDDGEAGTNPGGISRAFCKTGFSVILNAVKDLNLLKIRDASLRSK